jgi:hypothetical protein
MGGNKARFLASFPFRLYSLLYVKKKSALAVEW